MKLLTAELRKQLPALRSTDSFADPLVVAHLFNPSGVGDWFITEGGAEGDDFVFFGLCDIFEPELGYVSLAELESVRGPFGLGIERDLHWTPKPLSVVMRARER